MLLFFKYHHFSDDRQDFLVAATVQTNWGAHALIRETRQDFANAGRQKINQILQQARQNPSGIWVVICTGVFKTGSSSMYLNIICFDQLVCCSLVTVHKIKWDFLQIRKIPIIVICKLHIISLEVFVVYIFHTCLTNKKKFSVVGLERKRHNICPYA